QAGPGRIGPPGACAPGRQVLVTNAEVLIVAAVRHELGSDGLVTVPSEGGIVGRNLIDVLGPTQPLTTFGARAGVLEVPLADGSLAFATVHGVAATNGDIAVLQARAAALAA